MKIFIAHLFKYALVFFAFFFAIVPLALVQLALAVLVAILSFFLNANRATQELMSSLDKHISFYVALDRFKKTVKETVRDV